MEHTQELNGNMVETIKVLNVNISKAWLQWTFERIAIDCSESVSRDKESYVRGKVDGLFESLDDETFAYEIIESAKEARAIF